MKTSTLILAFVMLASGVTAFAQSVVVTGKMTTYHRVKPMDEYKKTFTVNYPKIRASTPAISVKIENAISYKKVLGLDVNDELRNTQWLEEADYEVEYNKHGILSIALSMDGSGAYPSGSTSRVVVDTKTGIALRPADLFTNLPGLLAMVRKAYKAEVAAAIVEAKKDPENSDIEDTFKESAQYHPVKLDQMTISDKGVTFHHDYEFAHVIQALQPDGEYTFTWAQLKPYIKPAGLLAGVAR